MREIDRRARIREYKETRQPAGIFRIRNTARGRSLIGSTVNLPGMLNRQRFQLEHGSHPDRELQSDWRELGAGAFVFEVLDRLEPRDEPGYDPAEDLRVLKEMWLEKLAASGEPLYPRSRRGT
ncbi:MAG TPA: GIY-YIG nuclease family protein [Thermoanaerobaculaceae bacterium]|nr:GIY-YIG nuclease family protein [Thermoanaerobaculaceae bacterium]